MPVCWSDGKRTEMEGSVHLMAPLESRSLARSVGLTVSQIRASKGAVVLNAAPQSQVLGGSDINLAASTSATTTATETAETARTTTTFNLTTT